MHTNHIIGLQDILYIRLPDHGRVETTAGRLIFNNALFPELWQYEKREDGTYSLGKVMDKKTVGKLVDQCFQLFGNEKTAELLDRIKSLGYSFARRAGMTVAIADIKVPEVKNWLIRHSGTRGRKSISYVPSWSYYRRRTLP